MTPVGLLAGLSLAASIGILFLLLMVTMSFRLGEESIIQVIMSLVRDLLKKSNNSMDSRLRGNDSNINIPTILMLIWCFAACFWAPDLILSLKAVGGLLFFAIATLYLSSIDKSSFDELYNIAKKPLLYGLLCAIILFFVEYYSTGMISTTFRNLIQHKNMAFELPWLDRGVVFISLLSWVVMHNLLKQRQIMLAISIYASVTFMLYLSDSLAGFVGFILASIAYVALYLSKMRLGWLMRICFALYIVTMPIMAYKQDPLEISNKYSIPDSAKHRLFIWNFAAKKIADHPIIGYGFSASKNMATENDIVHYGQYKWCLLPLHPHNNVLQILLETGMIGLILFMAIVDNILKWTIRNNSIIAAACFINYFFIGTISFGIWQSWWIGVGALFVVLIRKR
jgi:hypothetical protein